VSFVIITDTWLVFLDCLNTLIMMKSEIDNVVSDVLGQEHAIIKHVLRTTCHTVIKALVKFTLVGLPYVMMDTFRDLFETYTSFQTSYRAILRNVWL